MLFNTISFYAVFIVFLAMYAVLQRTSRTLMMLYVVLFSLFFFSRMNPDVLIFAAPGLNEYGILREAVKALMKWNQCFEELAAAQKA